MNETWLLIGTVAIAGAAILFSWILRIAPTLPRADYNLDDLEVAYLFGGRERAKELAFFFLLRDGWIKGDRSSQFTARFDDAPETLNAGQREILRAISERGSVTIQDLRKIQVPYLESVERRLVRKLLILPPHRIAPYGLVARLPLGLATLMAVKMGGESYIRGEKVIVPVVVAILSWFAVRFMDRTFSFRTSAGEKVLATLRQEIRDRTRGRNEVDEHGHHYDRLWSLHDELLLKGFAAFSGLTSFMSMENDPSAPKPDVGEPISFKRD